MISVALDTPFSIGKVPVRNRLVLAPMSGVTDARILDGYVAPFPDDSFIAGARKFPALVPLLPGAGGHVGFHGAGSEQPWSDIAIARFFDHG